MADDDNAAAKLIAQLSAEAEFVDTGAFTLDPAAARIKLREHQLPSEGAWALLLLEAGELAGVDRIEVSEGLTAVRVHLLGDAAVRLAPFDQLDMLFAWAFASSDAAAQPGSDASLVEARRLLALAVNDVLDRSVELTVTTAERGVGLRFDESTNRRRDVGGGRPGLVVEIDVPARRSLAQPAEALIQVARRAGYGKAPVFVGRRRVAVEVPRIEECRVSRPLVLDGREIGYAGLQAHDHALPRIVFAPHGVWYGAINVGARPSAFVAVVTRGLDRDLSFTQVVENDAYRRVRALTTAAHHELAALEVTMPMPNESVAISSWSADLQASLRLTTVVLGLCVAVALVLTLTGPGLLTGGTVIIAIVASALGVLRWIVSIHVRRMQILFPKLFPKPSLTAKEEALFFGPPSDRTR
jgi:hypothetical protein